MVAMIRQWVYEGHGFIGIGEPTAYEKGGHFFQLADVMGVDKELGFTLSTDKYFNEKIRLTLHHKWYENRFPIR